MVRFVEWGVQLSFMDCPLGRQYTPSNITPIPSSKQSINIKKSCLQDIATENDRKELFKELRLMANVGDHPNIVNLVGACSRGGRSLTSRCLDTIL